MVFYLFLDSTEGFGLKLFHWTRLAIKTFKVTVSVLFKKVHLLQQIIYLSVSKFPMKCTLHTHHTRALFDWCVCVCVCVCGCVCVWCVCVCVCCVCVCVCVVCCVLWCVFVCVCVCERKREREILGVNGII